MVGLAVIVVTFFCLERIGLSVAFEINYRIFFLFFLISFAINNKLIIAVFVSSPQLYYFCYG